MGRKKHTAEEIVAKLRQVDVLVSQGRKVAEAIRSIAAPEPSSGRQRITTLQSAQVLLELRLTEILV